MVGFRSPKTIFENFKFIFERKIGASSDSFYLRSLIEKNEEESSKDVF